MLSRPDRDSQGIGLVPLSVALPMNPRTRLQQIRLFLKNPYRLFRLACTCRKHQLRQQLCQSLIFFYRISRHRNGLPNHHLDHHHQESRYVLIWACSSDQMEFVSLIAVWLGNLRKSGLDTLKPRNLADDGGKRTWLLSTSTKLFKISFLEIRKLILIYWSGTG